VSLTYTRRPSGEVDVIGDRVYENRSGDTIDRVTAVVVESHEGDVFGPRSKPNWHLIKAAIYDATNRDASGLNIAAVFA
jgi:hypothetical protein